MMKKITSVLVVDAIEPVLPLWDAVGLQRVAEVPHGDKLGFVMLTGDGVELMYQTRDSIQGDEPRALPLGPAAIFVEVASLEEITKRIPAGSNVIIPRRETFYNSTELIMKDAGGNVITFAQMKKAE